MKSLHQDSKGSHQQMVGPWLLCMPTKDMAYKIKQKLAQTNEEKQRPIIKEVTDINHGLINDSINSVDDEACRKSNEACLVREVPNQCIIKAKKCSTSVNEASNYKQQT